MICHEIREKLALRLYDELSPTERAQVETHLAGCTACRLEAAALATVRRGLDETPVAAGIVDLAHVYRNAGERHGRNARRWRLAALAGAAAAVVVLITQLEIRANAGQLVIRWGQPEAIPAATHAETIVERPQPAMPPDIEERLAVMTKLIHALAANVQTGETRRSEQMARMQTELAGLQEQSRQHWKESEREMKGLYTAQFGTRQSGDQP